MNVREGRIPEGKGMFAYILENSWTGDMKSLADYLKANNYSWFAPKMQDGSIVFNTNGQQALLDQLVPELDRVGIALVGWGYVYGETNWYRKLYKWCDKEIAITLQMIGKYKPIAWIVDAEKEYKTPDGKASAVKYMNGIKEQMALTNDAIPDIPVGFSSYRFPNYHTELPWLEFLSRSDFAAPQVYWWGDTTPDGSVDQLITSIAQHKQFGAQNLPFVPAGTFRNDAGSWWATATQIENFNQACYEMEEIVGMNYWDLRLSQQRQELKNAANNFVWEVDEPTEPPTPPPTGECDCQLIFDAFSWCAEELVTINRKLDQLLGEEPTEPPTEPPTTDYVNKTVYRDGNNVYLSWYIKTNNNDAPEFIFYPSDGSKVAERVFVPSNSVLRAYKNGRTVGDGGNVAWKLDMSQSFPLAPGSSPVPSGVQLYIMEKFIV